MKENVSRCFFSEHSVCCYSQHGTLWWTGICYLM